MFTTKFEMSSNLRFSPEMRDLSLAWLDLEKGGASRVIELLDLPSEI